MFISLPISDRRTSRNKRKTDRANNLDLMNVVGAIKAIKLENITFSAASRAYGIPKTCLFRYAQKVSSQHENIAIVTDEELLETVKRSCSYVACAVKQVIKFRQTI